MKDFTRSFPPILTLTLSLVAVLAGAGFAEARDGARTNITVNDAAIRSKFQKSLEKIMDLETGAKTEDLLKQLKERREFELDLPAPDPDAAPLKPTEIYERARKATLVFGHIYLCDKCPNWHSSLAGGVVIDPSGIAVTNYHVMDHARAGSFGAMTADGTVFPVVEVLAASRKDDLAIVRLDGGPFTAVPVSMGDSVGSDVWVLSHPARRFYVFTEGMVARYYSSSKYKTPRLQITADYAKGSSGCGVFNEAGQLTGIVATTNSIYYEETKEKQTNLQMVVKSCIPAATVRKLTESDGTDS